MKEFLLLLSLFLLALVIMQANYIYNINSTSKASVQIARTEAGFDVYQYGELRLEITKSNTDSCTLEALQMLFEIDRY